MQQFTYLKSKIGVCRFLNPHIFHSYLRQEFPDVNVYGYSTAGKPIFSLVWGNGDMKVAAWTQMHGNESTGTLAMVDLLSSLTQQPKLAEALKEKIELHILFMLNPDGSEVWTRTNGDGVDINRDFLSSSTAEMKLLRKFLSETDFDYGLNLHDQRTIFTTDGIHPATLSFLSPSADVERSLTRERKMSMAVIAKMYHALRENLPNGIGRYTDEFYPGATGDNLMLQRLPNILFEGGHFPDDYYRTQTRKYYTLALYEALVAIAELKGSAEGWELYQDIPLNKETHYDIIYRNVKLATEHECTVDIAVQFGEEVNEEKTGLNFVPVVREVGRLNRKRGWQEIDCAGKQYISASTYPKVDEPVNFELI